MLARLNARVRAIACVRACCGCVCGCVRAKVPTCMHACLHAYARAFARACLNERVCMLARVRACACVSCIQPARMRIATKMKALPAYWVDALWPWNVCAETQSPLCLAPSTQRCLLYTSDAADDM
eukprot:14176536-Alexandrium_andersonii.AAC.1